MIKRQLNFFGCLFFYAIIDCSFLSAFVFFELNQVFGLLLFGL